MTGKEKLLYLIKHYKSGNYLINDFCDLFINVFYLEVENNELTDYEFECF